MIATVQRILRSTDAAVAGAYLSVFRERDALVPLLFHSLFRDESEIDRNDIDPLDRITVARLRACVKYYLDHGYRFVSPDDLLAQPPEGRLAMVTFDDGYFNNTLALPVLEEFNIPAVFFISTGHVRLGKCFWWDVLHRERTARHTPPETIDRERRALKRLRTEDIERRLIDEFGPNCLAPRGDIDRPFTPDELRDFSRHRLVRLGNHTADHAILTNYPEHEAKQQVAAAQQWLTNEIGFTPTAIAYPNGGSNDAVVRYCHELGLKLGFTVRPRKSPLPLDVRAGALLRLGRFTPHADSPVDAQCRAYRSDLQLYGTFRSGYLKLRGREEVY